MARKGSRIRCVYMGDEEEASLPKKKNCSETSVLFLFLSVIAIQNLCGGTYYEVAYTKVLCSELIME
jgi:hypothetical protein